MFSFQNIAQKLKTYTPKKLSLKGLQEGAVLVPIFKKEHYYYVLFTKRTEELSTHKGQISFPGGKLDEHDSSLEECALRETWEEIGVPKTKIRIIGELDQIKTNGSNILLSSFVGQLMYPFELKVNRKEVQEIIKVPLIKLLEENRWRKETVDLNDDNILSWYFNYKKWTIWGATAKIIRQFLSFIEDDFEY
ncbi:MAG: CoA pyrophosphatase [Asgard group archaeon]|nr:CoA pyrophosphatase [Asgard group archaeon]